MAEILLIRHGQASFASDDYDRLSELGQRQASALGEYLRNCNVSFDYAYQGELDRQQETARIVLSKQRNAVQCDVRSAFNEIEQEKIIEYYSKLLSSESDEIMRLVEGGLHIHKNFQSVFRASFHRWISEEDGSAPVKSWKDFSSGAIGGFKDVMTEQGAGKTVAIFTSGGVIATIFAHYLGTASTHIYNLYGASINCAITRFIYSGDRVSLMGFNDHFYLHGLSNSNDESLVTHI